MTRAAPGYGLAMSEPQTVVVTGASAGVGRAVARAFGARGANVAVLARGEEGLEGAAKTSRPPVGPPLAIPVDVANAAAVEAAASQVVSRFGALDVWVNKRVLLGLRPVLADLAGALTTAAAARARTLRPRCRTHRRRWSCV